MADAARVYSVYRGAVSESYQMNADIPILAVGDLAVPEFQGAAESLTRHGALTALDAAAALTAINEGFAPAVVVVAQCWPGQFATSQIDALRRAAPLARFVSLLGTWLEGETRTGRPLAACRRVYWHRWDDFTRSLGEGRVNSWSAWSLPSTATDDERLLLAAGFEPADSPIGATSPLLIAIVARAREAYQSLADICVERGWQTVWFRNVENETSLDPDIVLLDATNSSEADLTTLIRLRAAARRPPIIALLGFPRVEDASRWKTAGAAAVVSKPFQSHSLLSKIDDLVAKSVPAT